MTIKWDIHVAKLAELVVLDAEPGRFAVYGWKNITVAIWTARVETDAVERLARASAAYCVSYPQGLSNIHLVQQDIGLPDGHTRKRLIELSRGATPHLATVSAVVGGQGFWASRMRSLITGVRMMVPGPFEMRLFGDSDEIVDWLPRVHERRTGVRVEASEIRELLAHCSARLRASRAPEPPRSAGDGLSSEGARRCGASLPPGPVSGIQGLAGPARTESLTPPAARSGSDG